MSRVEIRKQGAVCDYCFQATEYPSSRWHHLAGGKCCPDALDFCSDRCLLRWTLKVHGGCMTALVEVTHGDGGGAGG